MIIKGGEHDNAGNLARYLLTPKDGETPALWELRDSASDDLMKSLTDWEIIGRCKTRGSKILYHVHIRLCDGEALEEEQWYKTIEDLEQRLGLARCPRAIVSHNNAEKGLHVHVVWSRFDPARKPLVQLGNDHQHHHAVARDAEKAFGLQPAVEPGKEKGPRKRRLPYREDRALKDRCIDKDNLARIMRAAWDSSDTGREMKAMLGSMGVQIEPGDRRDWVVRFQGLKMNPVRLLDDVKTAQFRERMQDVDLTKEKERQRETALVDTIHRRKAHKTVRGDLGRLFAGEGTKKMSKPATRKARQPRSRPKMLYDDPGR